MSEKLNVSVLFRSNLFQLADCFRARVPLSPFSPKIMMNTLASVPAPGVDKTRALVSLTHSPLALASLLGSWEEPGVHVGKFRVVKARDEVKKGWSVYWGSRSTTLSFVLHLSLVNAIGLNVVLVIRLGWFVQELMYSAETYLSLKACHVDWLYSLEINSFLYNVKVPCSHICLWLTFYARATHSLVKPKKSSDPVGKKRLLGEVTP